MNVSAGLVHLNTPLGDDHRGQRRTSWAPVVPPGDLTGNLLTYRHDNDQRRPSSFVCRRSASLCPDRFYDALNQGELSERRRIRINVRGKKYETFISTLEQFPDTLLGSDGGRDRFYDSWNEELRFTDRDPNSFDAILFFYQSRGQILARPSSVDEDLFDEEVKFFRLFEENEDQLQTDSTCSLLDDLLPPLHPGTTRRERLWNILEWPTETRCGRIFARVSWVVILLSVITFCLETVQSLKNLPVNVNKSDEYPVKNRTSTPGTNTSNFLPPASTAPGISVSFWFFVDTIFVVFFTAEYIARVYSAPNRLKFIRSFLAIVDFCAIAPYYILHIAKAGQLNNIKSLVVIRSIRLFRVIRLLKLSRYSSGLRLLGRALLMSKGKMMSLCCCVVMAVVFYSGLLYYIEGYQEDNIFTSIPDAFWYSIITMSTVGYGDVVPKTPPGKLVGAFCALTGIILLYILPIPSFVTDFSKLYEKWLRVKARTKAKGGNKSDSW